MPRSPTDRMKILQALWDDHCDVNKGTPQERLIAQHAKAKVDRFLERMKRLSIKRQGEVWIRLPAGDAPEELLPE
jgi:hypothetical protein